MSLKSSVSARFRAVLLGVLCGTAFLPGCASQGEHSEKTAARQDAEEITDPLVIARRNLMKAATNPYLYSFDAALADVSDVNYIDERTGLTPLMRSVLSVEPEQVKKLLAKGADPNMADKNGFTPVHCAVGLFSNEPLEILLDAGAECDTPDKDGKTPFLEAVRLGEMEAAELLLKHGADVKAEDKRGRNALIFAAMARYNSLKMTKQLLEKQSVPDKADKDDETALLTALTFGNTGCALYLIGRMPDPSEDDSAEAVCLMALKRAIEMGNLPVFRTLVPKCPELNPVQSVITKFMGRMDIEGIYQLSARHNLLPDGKMPLFWAAEQNNVVMIQELYDAGADPLLEDETGSIPGNYARTQEAVKLFQKLEKRKAAEYRASVKDLK